MPDSKLSHDLPVPPIEWRNVPRDQNQGTWLLLQGLLLWGISIAVLIGGIVWARRGVSGGLPLLAFDMLVFVPILTGLTIWNWPNSEQRIVVDFDRQEVLFEHLRRYTRFLPEPRADRVICRFDEILAVEPRFRQGAWSIARAITQGRGAVLTIHTSQGRFVVRFQTQNADQLHEALYAIACGEPIPMRQLQWFPAAVGAILVFAVLIALFVLGVLP